MKPVKQEFRHNPAIGEYGDCHRAALASILDLRLVDVPHFAAGAPADSEFWRRVDDFMASRGLIEISIPFHGDDLAGVLATIKNTNPRTYFILGGRSRTGCNHSVVCCDDEIVHDPSLDDAGIIGPMDDGFYRVDFIGSRVAFAT